MSKLFDSHAHYYDRRFNELEGGADALLSKLFDEDVEYVIAHYIEIVKGYI